MFKSLHIYNIWSNFMIQFNRPTYITLCCPEINLATQYKVTLVNKTLLKALLCSTHHSCVSERPNLWYLYSSKSFRAGGFFGDFLETVVPRVDLNTTAPPPTSSPVPLTPANSVGYITCKWEDQHPAVITMDTRHGLTHALYILAGPLCMCAVVCVSEVGQPRCYLTRPEKTSGELITASCAQTKGNHQSYACKRPAHTRSCEQARTNIWLTFWPHTRRKAHKQIKATCLQACVHAKTVKWVHEAAFGRN